MERRIYLRRLIEDLKSKPTSELISHIGNFAYDPKNHQILIDLNTLEVLQSLLQAQDHSLHEFILGAICNFSSNKNCRALINIELIRAQWDSVSDFGQRSIACILFYFKENCDGLESKDKVTQNLLKCSYLRNQ